MIRTRRMICPSDDTSLEGGDDNASAFARHIDDMISTMRSESELEVLRGWKLVDNADLAEDHRRALIADHFDAHDVAAGGHVAARVVDAVPVEHVGTQ